MSETFGRERLYLAFMVLGFVAPLILVGIWIGDNGLDLGEMVDAIGANKLALAVFCDITIASLVFWSWAAQEGPALGIRRWWIVIPATLIIGLCFALPLFLYWRERALRGGAPAAGASA